MELACSESNGMVVPVLRLGEILADEILRRMAVVTPGHRLVAGFGPGIQVVLHNVTVCTGVGIISQVRGPLGIVESERTKANGKAHNYAQETTNCTTVGRFQ